MIKFKTGLIIPVLLMISSFAGFSQTAPAPIKIDGKIGEWTMPFQLNKPTKLSYIISNDKRYVYLVIKSSDSLVNSRILLTGIDFMVSASGKKKEGPFVMFPVIERVQMQRAGRGGAPTAGAATGAPGALTAATAKTPAELIQVHRAELDKVKEFKVSGFKEITEPSISIYNEYGIKGVGTFDDQDNFIYELAIPLNLFGLSADTDQDVAYNIKINGSAGSNLATIGGRGPGGFGGGDAGFGGGGDRGGAGGFGGGDRGGAGGFGAGGRGAAGGRGGNVNLNRFYEPSDFWVNVKLTKIN